MRAATAVLAAVVGLLLVAGPAHAGAVYGAFYFAGEGEDNDILVEVQPGTTPGLQEHVFTDRSGAPIQCGYYNGVRDCPQSTFEFSGCRRGAHPNEAICAYVPPALPVMLFYLHGGNDRVQVEPEAGVTIEAYGGDGNDVLDGTPGADQLHGEGDDDTLRGAGGADVLRGGSHADQLDGGFGDDDISGGAGFDALGYGGRFAGVSVYLDDLPNDGDRAAGELDNARGDIEVVSGTEFRDILEGGTRPNELHGGGGNDLLAGGPGTASDLLDGGPGADETNYAGRSEAVVVDLRTPGGDGRPGENDDVRTENVRGGAAADVLTGDAGANVLDGNDGDDRLSGGGGVDDLLGAGGDDRLSGVELPAASDFLSCGGGRDNAVGDNTDRVARDCENPDVFVSPPAIMSAGGAAVFASPTTAAVVLGCDSLVPCVGRIALVALPDAGKSAASAAARRVLARGRFNLRPGRQATRKLRLTRAGRAAVRRARRRVASAAARGRFRATLELIARDAAGHRTRERRRVRVRLGRAPAIVLPPLFDPLPEPVTQPPPEGPGDREAASEKPVGCVDDAAEDNDSFLDTTPTSVGSSSEGRVCPGDPDFYELVLADGATLTATVKPAAATDVRVDIYLGAASDPVSTGSAAGPGQPETASHKNSSGGDLKVYVRVVGDEGAYSLTAN